VPLTTRPRLLGLDLDGTVVDHNNHIPDKTLTELHACRESGIELAFLTGRRPLTAAPHLERIGIDCYAATNSGCLLWEYPGWHLVRKCYFPPDLLRPLATLLEPYSASFFVNRQEAGFEFFILDRTPTPELDIYRSRYADKARRVTDISEIMEFNITQIAMPGPELLVHELRDLIRKRYGRRLLALSVLWPLLPTLTLEVFHRDANKGSALAYIAEQYDIPPEATVAVGDDVNDLAMLHWAGYSAAMPQAGGEVVDVADEQLAGNGAHALPELLARLRSLPPE
jgi:hypothetical protein